jgi:hypothetical protein
MASVFYTFYSYIQIVKLPSTSGVASESGHLWPKYVRAIIVLNQQKQMR